MLAVGSVHTKGLQYLFTFLTIDWENFFNNWRNTLIVRRAILRNPTPVTLMGMFLLMPNHGGGITGCWHSSLEAKVY
jgi:hypothetical protein